MLDNFLKDKKKKKLEAVEGKCDTEMRTRIGRMKESFQKLSKMLKNRKQCLIDM